MGPDTRKPGLLFVAALAFYLCVAVFFFREAVFTERVQVCCDTALSTYPWSLVRDEGFEMRNPAAADQCTVFYPWFHYTAKMLKQGEVVLWTPHVFGGVPYLGNLSTAIFYPLNLLLAIIPVNSYFLVQSIFKLVAAGIFTYLLLKRLGLGFVSSLFGGTVYACSGFMILWMISNLTSVAVLLPALLWSTEIFLDRKNGPSLCLVIAFLALQFLGAHPETSLCVSAAWGIYTFFRVHRGTGLFNRQAAAIFSYLVMAGLLAIGLVMFQLWPFVEYMSASYGLELRNQAARSASLYGGGDPLYTSRGAVLGLLFVASVLAAAWFFRRGRKPGPALFSGVLAGLCLCLCVKAGFGIGLKPHLLVQLFPDLYGSPFDGVRAGGGSAYPEFNGGYVGVLAFLLALCGSIACRKRSPVGIFTCLFILSFGTVHGLPVVSQVIRSLPVFDVCQPGRILCITAFSAAMLSAFGLDHLLTNAAGKGNRRLPALKAVGAACALLGAGTVFGWGFFEPYAGNVLSGSVADDALKEHNTTPAGIELSVPRPGHAFSAEKGLVAEGMAGPRVTSVRFFLDGLGIGTVPVSGEDGSGGKRFSFSVPLDRTKEGIHWFGVKAEPSLEPEEGESRFYSMPVTVTHPKEISFKNTAIFLGAAALFMIVFLGAFTPALRGGLALAAVLVELVMFGAWFNCTTEPDMVFPDNPVTDFLSARPGLFRVLPENATLQPSTNYLYGYHVLRGYDCLENPEFNKVVSLLKRDQWVDIHHYNSRTLDYESPVLDLLNVRYIVSTDDLSGINGLHLAPGGPDGPCRVYENTEAMQRACVAGHWININTVPGGNLASAIRHLEPLLRRKCAIPENEPLTMEKSMALLLKNFAFLEKDIELEGGGSGTVEIEEYENESVRLKVSMNGEGILILTDNHFPGWRVMVDGEERELFRSLSFRAVPLRHGEHVVEFVYHPGSFYAGCKISLASLVLLLLFAFVPSFTSLLRRRQFSYKT